MMIYRFRAMIIGICLLLWAGISLTAQTLTSAETRFADTFSEWTLYAAEEEGELLRRWQSGDDWTSWDYRLGGHSGQIQLKWTGNPNEWEIRGDNQIITARTIWKGDFREWRISSPGHRIELRSRYKNILEEWAMEKEETGYFGMYTTWEGDPRAWTIVDELDESVSFPIKMALVFLVLYHSTPKL